MTMGNALCKPSQNVAKRSREQVQPITIAIPLRRRPSKNAFARRHTEAVLFAGNVGAGKTALAVQMALSSDFPFVKLCTPENMIGFTESAKCQSIKKVLALYR